MKPLDLFKSKLKNVKPHGNYFTAKCPAHDDKHSSLSFREDTDGTVGFKCHANCEKERILDAMGLEWKDVFPEKEKKSEIEATYDYTDEEEKMIYQVVRMSGKKFMQRQPDGAGGWNWNLKGIKPVPYRLHKIVKADKNKPIIIVEGEKDVRTLENYGLLATTNSGGAGKWLTRYNKYLAGHNTIILNDNDDTGRAHAKSVGNGLLRSDIICKNPQLPGLKEKGDVTDWFDIKGNDLEKFRKICKSTSLYAFTKIETPESKPEATADFKNTFKNAPFKILGYWKQALFFMNKDMQQVLEFTPDKLGTKNLLLLAPIQWYEQNFMYESKLNWNYVVNALITESKRVGIYDVNRVRGTGAWWDEGRVILHVGDRLIVDGTDMRIIELETKNIYERRPCVKLSNKEPLGVDQAHKLIELVDKLAWEKGIDGRLLCGWMVLGPICGVLTWRPHLFLTGKRGCGKSWIIREIAKPVLGAGCLWVEGDSTGPGIRQALGMDALPVLYDESESQTKVAEERMQAVVELMRQASSEGGKIFKGTSAGKGLKFHIQSMFMLSAIGVHVTQSADISRISVITLGEHAPGTKIQAFKEIKHDVIQLLTKDYCSQLRARIVNMIRIIRTNSDTLSEAIAEHIGERRLGDQLGTLLSGAYALFSDKEITREKASSWVQDQDWTEHKEEEHESDEWTVLNIILQSLIRVVETGTTYERSIVRLVRVVAQIPDDSYALNIDEPELAWVEADIKQEDIEKHIAPDIAHNLLQSRGIKVDEKKRQLIFARSHTGIAHLLRDTAWVRSWDKMLIRIEGATKKNPTTFETGVKCRAIAINLKTIFEDEGE